MREAAINILLVDDHGMFREGTALLLKSLDSSITVAHARSARECLDKAAADSYDLVLLDLGLPDKPGLDALSDLKHAHPDLPVVVLSGQEERETVLDAIKRGAMGFIPKSSEDPKLLWHALKMAVSGSVTVPMSMTGASAAQISDVERPAPIQAQDLGLTQRQLEVLRLVVQGLPNKSIARRLDIAETTARGYVSELLAAFRVTNRTQLVLDVAKRGLVLGNTFSPS
jgi:DNA-binding NarL/FixJ family response regulator